MAAIINGNVTDTHDLHGELIDAAGNKYDASKYHVADGKIIENGTNRFVAWQDRNRLTNAARKEADKTNPEVQKEKQAQAEKNARAKAAFGNILQSAGQAAASATKPSPVSNPQAQHNARQAALAENQAAKLRAQQQQANQIANRTSTTTGAMNEAQKVAEQSALQKQRLASQQMVGDAGLANAAAAKAGAEVDPSQHFSEMQALGSQERQRAIELGKQAYAGQSAAERDRATTTAEIEEKQVRAKHDQQAEAASYADADRQAAQDKLNADLINSQIAKNNAESTKAAAEGQKTNVETTAQSESQATAYEKQIYDMLKNPATIDPITIMQKYVALHNLDNAAGNAIMRKISEAIGPQSEHKEIGQKALEHWLGKNPDSPHVEYMTAQLSDKRMKSIETPIGHALMNIWKGRTM